MRVSGWGTASSAEFSTASSGTVTEAAQRGPFALLSQWSFDDSHANGPGCAASVTVPLLAVENSADDAVPQPDPRILFDAAASRDKKMHVIKGGTHYYQGQPEQLAEAVQLCLGWLRERRLQE